MHLRVFSVAVLWVLIVLCSGADVESQAQDHASILFEASASGNPDVISLLLEYGADANIPKHTGHLPIHRVAHRGHVKLVQHTGSQWIRRSIRSVFFAKQADLVHA